MSEEKDRLREGKTITNMKEPSKTEKPEVKPAPQKPVEDVDIFEFIDVEDGDELEIEGPTTEEQLEVANDRYLRLMAEFENHKKRTVKERTDFSKSCNDSIILDLIGVLDNFERAMKVDTVGDGMKMIYNNFKLMLDRRDIKVIECIDKSFDTNYMDAITTIENNLEPGIVLDVIEKGYIQNNRIIRFAKVVVSK